MRRPLTTAAIAASLAVLIVIGPAIVPAIGSGGAGDAFAGVIAAELRSVADRVDAGEIADVRTLKKSVAAALIAGSVAAGEVVDAAFARHVGDDVPKSAAVLRRLAGDA